MGGLRRFVRRLAAFFGSDRAETELSREVEAHRALVEEDLVRRGATPDAARAAAARAFVGIESAKDAQRDARSFVWLEDLRRDVRYALHVLASMPGFTLAVILTLGLGIGVASSVFSLVRAVVLRPLDYAEPDRLVQIFETGPREGGESDWATYPSFRDWRASSHEIEHMSAYRFGLLTLTGTDPAETVLGLEVTDRLFELLGVAPAVGRTFAAGEDRPGSPRVAVIGHALWQRHFHGDPAVIGRSIMIDDVAHTIVGVMPASFRFPMSIPGAGQMVAEAWIPIRPSSDLEDRGSHNFWVVARLGPGVTLDRARASMATIGNRLARQYPDTNKDFGVAVEPLKQHVAGAARPALLLLLATVGFVLLLTCVNIANLLLVRSEARRREMAMRQALGASPGRLVRQVLTESLVLAGGGALVGLATAFAGIRILVALAPDTIPRLEQSSLDPQVLLVMLAVSLAAGLLFGLVPARFGSRVDVPDALKDGARVSGGASRIRQVLVAGQVALALMLLVGAGLLVRSFLRVAGLDLGFRAPHVLTAFIGFPPARYGQPAQQIRFVDELLRRVETLPGVASAAVSHTIPMTGINDQGGFAVEGRPDSSPGLPSPHANRPHVSPAYFDTMGIRLLSGRLFDQRDGPTGAPVAIVSDLAVRRYWPDGHPLGRRLATEWGADGRPVWRQIVGVVQSTRHFGLEEPQKAEVYLPFAQAPVPFITLVVRTTGNPTEYVNGIRAQVRAIDPQQSVFGFRTMEDLVTASGAPRRFQTALVATFGALALILAAIGIYGVMGYMVTQRSREIGVRLALGARPRDVVLMVLRNGVWLTLAGVLAGLAGTFALSRVLAGFLYGVSALDPTTYVATIGVLVTVAIVAAYRPSRRAASVDPLVVLRDG